MSKHALVVGLGIAGMSAALGLLDAGWTPVIVERAPARRSGGYFITLFPQGKAAAEELGVLGQMRDRTPSRSATWELDRAGKRLRSSGLLDQKGNPRGMLRGDIEQALWDNVDGRVEIRYLTTPIAFVEAEDGVQVTLENPVTGDRTVERFDLVVGADGVRSTTRRLAFGPDEEFMRSRNSIACAFLLDEQVPEFDDRDAVTLAEAGRAVWIFPCEDRAPCALFTYRTTDVDAQFTRPPAEILKEVFAKDAAKSPIVRHALDAISTSTDYLFDSTNQISMPSWHNGRIVMLGDAAWCMTLYAGMGATASLLGGVTLGKSLRENPDDIAQALSAYEDELRPFIAKETKKVKFKHQIFVPSGKVMKRVRRSLMLHLGRKLDRKEKEQVKLLASAQSRGV